MPQTEILLHKAVWKNAQCTKVGNFFTFYCIYIVHGKRPMSQKMPFFQKKAKKMPGFFTFYCIYIIHGKRPIYQKMPFFPKKKTKNARLAPLLSRPMNNVGRPGVPAGNARGQHKVGAFKKYPVRSTILEFQFLGLELCPLWKLLYWTVYTKMSLVWFPTTIFRGVLEVTFIQMTERHIVFVICRHGLFCHLLSCRRNQFRNHSWIPENSLLTNTQTRAFFLRETKVAPRNSSHSRLRKEN